MTPSNANTSGLEVVAWRWETPIPHVGDGTKWGWSFASHWSTPPSSLNAEPLVTAASAQARISELEALVASIRRAQRDVVRAEIEQEGYAPISDANDRATAAEARADRLSERLRADPTPEQLEPFARKWCIDNGIDPDAPKPPHGEWPEWYDACGSFAAMWRDLARAALQQETQP